MRLYFQLEHQLDVFYSFELIGTSVDDLYDEMYDLSLNTQAREEARKAFERVFENAS